MPASRIERVKAIFLQASELALAERRAFLDEACSGDADLRAEVDSYLLDEENAGGFLSSSGERREFPADDPADLRVGPGTVIGRYKLLKLIGEGGFGSVFVAEQQTPVRRNVALKIIKLGMDTRQVIARFEAERQSLALLDHPNIAKVFDAGETSGGRPYFVMELVDGVPITNYCDDRKLPADARLALFIAICNALQHAHQKGIIHRDIKPSNILVTSYDGTAVPKLIDFGIAKATQSPATEKTLLTECRNLMGTPAYMSPEQAQMGGMEVDTRSDIYSLGVLLYELLTGTTPFDARELRSAASEEIRRILRDVDPPKPSIRLSALGELLSTVAADRAADPRMLRQLVRGELDWIVMKAMEKDRIRRYESAGELARDVGRYLKDQPVLASPPGTGYLVRKFLRRRRKSVALVLALVVMGAAGAGIYLASLRAEQKRTNIALAEARLERKQALLATDRALAAESRAVDQATRSAISQARAGRASMAEGRRFNGLAALAPAAKTKPTLVIRNEAAGCLVLADLRVLQEWRGPGDGICFSHDLGLFADSDPQNGDVLICRVPPPGGQSPPAILRLHVPIDSNSLAFSPDDRAIAISGTDGHVRVFSIDGTLILEIPSGPACDFTPDSTGLAAASPGKPIVVYDLASGKERYSTNFKAARVLRFSPDGRKIATWNGYGWSDQNIDVCDVAAGIIASLPHPGGVMQAEWRRDGKVLAIADTDGNIYQWNVAQVAHPLALPALMGHYSDVAEVKFNHAGNLLASSGWDGTTRLWDAVSGESLMCLARTGTLCFSSDDRRLGIAGVQVDKHEILEVASGGERRPIMPPPGHRGREVVFSPDGAMMACGGTNMVRVWNLTDPAPNLAPLDMPLTAQARSLAFAPAPMQLFATTNSGLWAITINQGIGLPTFSDWSLTGQLTFEPAFRQLLSLPAIGDGKMQISANGQRLAIAQYGQAPRLLKWADPGHPVIFDSASRYTSFISISRDMKWVATGRWKTSNETHVSIWDAATGRKVCDLPISLEANVAFSPDNRWLVTATVCEYRFWEVGTWIPRHSVPRNTQTPGYMAFSPDSSTLAVNAQDTGVQLIDANTGEQWVTLDDLEDELPAAFSPDGGTLVTFHHNSIIRLWDIRRLREELLEMGLDWPAPPLPPRKPLLPIRMAVGTR